MNTPAANEKKTPMIKRILVRCPATAKLTSDIYVGDRLAVPTGTLLVEILLDARVSITSRARATTQPSESATSCVRRSSP